MHRAIDPSQIVQHIVDIAQETTCGVCGRGLAISQHRDRHVWCLKGLVHQQYKDKRCPDEQCVGHQRLYRPQVDLRLALPRMSFGLDVVMAVGQRHLEQDQSLSRIGRDLTNSGVPIHQTHVGELLRDFVALCRLSRGDQAAVQQRLLKQGGIYLLVDGVQFDDKSPVLYLCWDGRSGTPLFGERLAKRDVNAVSEMLRRVKKMGVPVLGITTDGETSLVAAVHKVFPEVPHQLCQGHFLFNCAEPLEADLKELEASVEQRAEKVRQLNKRLERLVQASTAHCVTAPSPVEPAPLPQVVAAAQVRVEKTAEPAPLQPAVAAAQVRVEKTAPLPPAVAAAQVRVEKTVEPAPLQPAPLHPAVAAAQVQVEKTSEPAPQRPVVAAAQVQVEKNREPVAPVSELEMVRTLCEAVRLQARVSGKAPLNPRQLARHQRLEQVRVCIDKARKKKTRGGTGRPHLCSISSTRL